jgi:hypothetical protein
MASASALRTLISSSSGDDRSNLCVPDKEKSFLAGTFLVQVKGRRMHDRTLRCRINAAAGRFPENSVVRPREKVARGFSLNRKYDPGHGATTR